MAEERMTADTRKCTACKQVLPLTDFCKKQHKCKSCGKAAIYAWRANNRERARELVRESKARRMVLRRADHLVTRGRAKAKQRGHAAPLPPTRPIPDKCECCSRPSNKLRLDHCHVTGAFRGWICDNCNCGLGHFGEEPRGLKLGIEYLMRFYEEQHGSRYWPDAPSE